MDATTPTMSDLEIVPLTKSHLRRVMRIDADVYPMPWSRTLWLAELDRDERLYLVATQGQQIVGYVGALFALEDVHVVTIVTRPGCHRRGIGTRLLLEVVQQSIEHGCNALTLEVRISNEPAQALYKRFGLVPAGVRRGYYEPDDEDALVMWARDIDTPRYRDRMERLMHELEAAA